MVNELMGWEFNWGFMDYGEHLYAYCGYFVPLKLEYLQATSGEHPDTASHRLKPLQVQRILSSQEKTSKAHAPLFPPNGR
jgi:hypothetical protein